MEQDSIHGGPRFDGIRQLTRMCQSMETGFQTRYGSLQRKESQKQQQQHTQKELYIYTYAWTLEFPNHTVAGM